MDPTSRYAKALLCFVIYGSSLLALSCSSNKGVPKKPSADSSHTEQEKGPERMTQITKSQAIKAAEDHLTSIGALTGKYEADAKCKDETEWHVFFRFLPATPGDHVTVVIGSSGKVLRVLPGL